MGAAIYADNASLTIEGVGFDDHSADGSGGVIAQESTSAHELVIRGTLLNGGRAGGSGGCIYSTGGVNLELRNVVASRLSGGRRGGRSSSRARAAASSA